MNTINYIQLLLSFMISFMIIMSSLINNFEKYLPVFIVQTFRYGKFAYNKSSYLAIEVPKSWFKHFYVYASIIAILALCCALNIYIFDAVVPLGVSHFLDGCVGTVRQPSVNSSRILLALILVNLQSLRRAYDTHFVSVFSKNGKMNLSHYLVGYIHYTACIITILAEAPNFSRLFRVKNYLHWSDLNWLDGFATLLFLWAWTHQYNVTVILGNLRKNKKGEIITQEHKLPKGDLFEYVSSPHLLTEIVMYTALTLILWTNITWWFVYVWVLTNQVETALLSHWWYQEKFPELPKQRKVLIPFIF